MTKIKKFNEFINESLDNDDSNNTTDKKFIPFNKGKKMSEYLSPEQIEAFQKHQFKKGDIPFNKGKKLNDYLTPEQIKNIEKPQFKTGVHTGENSASWKGGIQNTKRDGKFIHTGSNERKRIARHNYEKEHGEIKKGWIIYHIDKDKDNDHIDNLIAVPRAILIRLNANRMNSNYHEIKTAVDEYISKEQINH